MFLNAIVLSGDVGEYRDFNSTTGAEQLSYSIRLVVLDAETTEKYTVQLNDGFELLEHLKQMKRQGAHADDLRQVADQLRQQLPPQFSTLPLQVLRFKGKSAQYMTLVCKYAATVAQAAAA